MYCGSEHRGYETEWTSLYMKMEVGLGYVLVTYHADISIAATEAYLELLGICPCILLRTPIFSLLYRLHVIFLSKSCI